MPIIWNDTVKTWNSATSTWDGDELAKTGTAADSFVASDIATVKKTGKRAVSDSFAGGETIAGKKTGESALADSFAGATTATGIKDTAYGTATDSFTATDSATGKKQAASTASDTFASGDSSTAKKITGSVIADSVAFTQTIVGAEGQFGTAVDSFLMACVATAHKKQVSYGQAYDIFIGWFPAKTYSRESYATALDIARFHGNAHGYRTGGELLNPPYMFAGAKKLRVKDSFLNMKNIGE